MALTYVTIDDLTAYIDGLTIDDPDAFGRLVERAERDIDSILGLWDLDPVTGLKWTPATELSVFERRALSDAVCAQVEYRLLKGEDFFVLPPAGTVVGPDFTIEGDHGPRIGPQVWAELARAPRLRRPVGMGRAYV